MDRKKNSLEDRAEKFMRDFVENSPKYFHTDAMRMLREGFKAGFNAGIDEVKTNTRLRKQMSRDIVASIRAEMAAEKEALKMQREAILREGADMAANALADMLKGETYFPSTMNDTFRNKVRRFLNGRKL